MKSYLSARLERLRKTMREVLYGMTAYELELEIKKERGHMDNLMMLIIVGDMAGLPMFPPYYSLRFLPHLVPHISRWKRSIFREKDLTDVLGKDL